MIPKLVVVAGCSWELLPPGIHDATLNEVYDRFGKISLHRQILFQGLKNGLQNIFASGCTQAFLDGSYVTSKPKPNDYEVCWDAAFVNPALLDPIFLDFTNDRYGQKQKYLGEYFPSLWTEVASGKTFLDFFQVDKQTALPKGILRIIK